MTSIVLVYAYTCLSARPVDLIAVYMSAKLFSADTMGSGRDRGHRPYYDSELTSVKVDPQVVTFGMMFVLRRLRSNGYYPK